MIDNINLVYRRLLFRYAARGAFATTTTFMLTLPERPRHALQRGRPREATLLHKVIALTLIKRNPLDIR